MDDVRTNEDGELTGPMLRVQERVGRPLGDELRDRYEARGQTLEQIGVDLGISTTTAHRWLRHFDIEARFPGARGKAVA